MSENTGIIKPNQLIIKHTSFLKKYNKPNFQSIETKKAASDALFWVRKPPKVSF